MSEKLKQPRSKPRGSRADGFQTEETNTKACVKVGLASSKTSKEANVAGVQQGRGRVVGRDEVSCGDERTEPSRPLEALWLLF